MTDKALLFVTAIPNPADQPAMQEYLQSVLPLLMKAGGTLLGRGAIQKVVEGNADFKLAMAMEFDSMEAAEAVFASDEYAALKAARDRGFSKIDITLGKAL